MSIQTELNRLSTAKSDLKSAIEEKGVTVPEGTKLDGFSALVNQIQVGGGGGLEGWTVYINYPTSLDLAVVHSDGSIEMGNASWKPSYTDVVCMIIVVDGISGSMPEMDVTPFFEYTPINGALYRIDIVKPINNCTINYKSGSGGSEH